MAIQTTTLDYHGAALPPDGGDGGLEQIHARAALLLEDRKFEEAAALLSRALTSRETDVTHGMLGTAYILLENYDAARRHLEQAIKLDGVTPEWSEKLHKAITNAAIHPEVEFPVTEPFTREQLLAAPEVHNGDLPVRPSGKRDDSISRRVRHALGVALGRVSTVVVDRLTEAAAKLGDADEVWTNWYRRPTLLALLTLASMRDKLNHNNLHDSYPAGAKSAFQGHGLIPPDGVRHFRTADGSWNNLDNPKEGAAGVRFPRSVRRSVTWPRQGAQLMTPNPAVVSQELLARGHEGMKPVPFLNLLAASWIQFNVHDWVSHRMSAKAGVYEIPLPPDHPARRLYHQTKMFVPRTEEDLTRMPEEAGDAPTYINEVTSWWDASQIYGSDRATAARLRSFEGGKLKLGPDGRLPLGPNGVDDAGFNRNWWLGLAMLHTLFVKEHNAVCDELARVHRDWDDNRLYHTARLIVAAVIAKIHTVEWTPAILPNRVLHLAMNANWQGLLETNTHAAAERSLFPFIKLQHPVLGGIVGNPIDKAGSPFGLSEEFTEVYRLHELLPDELTLRFLDSERVETVALADTRLGGSRVLSGRVAMADLFYSFGNMHPGQLVLNNFPEALRELSVPGNPVFDLAAVDILRARERGVPRYNEFRRQLNLKPIRSFEDLTSDEAALKKLKRIYDNDIEAIDLLVGTRAEAHRPFGFGFGETMFQLFILKASRRLHADRFYTDSYNEETYSKEGLAWVDAASLKSVLLRHYPLLAESGLGNIDNAFEPWDTGTLDPARHPLRAFERRGHRSA